MTKYSSPYSPHSLIIKTTFDIVREKNFNIRGEYKTMKILVLGGTRFFGMKTVEQLIEKNHEVTIATRGNTEHPFGNQVNHIILDVQDNTHAGWKEIVEKQWDAVFSNITYTKEDAELLIDKFTNITDHVYFTSSMAVYSGDKDGYVEEDFDPKSYEIEPNIEVNYGEGKRQAEQVLFTKAPFAVTSFRFPIVLDEDDYTKRLHYYVEKAIKDEKIYFKKADVKVNYVKGTTAADSIVWAIENQKEGIYNVSSADAITIATFVEWLDEAVSNAISVEYSDKETSPFSTAHDQYLISDKIAGEGFKLSNLKDWLKPLIKVLVAEMKKDYAN